jgi:hypothetical protein
MYKELDFDVIPGYPGRRGDVKKVRVLLVAIVNT